eukprot:4580171-Pleurochrysis_carterae.AAC.4
MQFRRPLSIFPSNAPLDSLQMRLLTFCTCTQYVTQARRLRLLSCGGPRCNATRRAPQDGFRYGNIGVVGEVCANASRASAAGAGRTRALRTYSLGRRAPMWRRGAGKRQALKASCTEIVVSPAWSAVGVVGGAMAKQWEAHRCNSVHARREP